MREELIKILKEFDWDSFICDRELKQINYDKYVDKILEVCKKKKDKNRGQKMNSIFSDTYNFIINNAKVKGKTEFEQLHSFLTNYKDIINVYIIQDYDEISLNYNKKEFLIDICIMFKTSIVSYITFPLNESNILKHHLTHRNYGRSYNKQFDVDFCKFCLECIINKEKEKNDR